MGRVIVVGDVHGCSTELQLLLDRLAYVAGSDKLIFVGDLVARGPDSLGVLDIVRLTGAIVVRGNHEDRLLGWQRARKARAEGRFALLPDLGRMHNDVARALRPEDWSLLEETPIHYELTRNRLLVVHAGVVPGVSIEQQDAATMMRIRSISDHGEARDHGGATPWGARYVGPPHVVFGHAASLEAQVHPWATGIDTGCVYGGYLTAMVLGADQEPPPVSERLDCLVSIPARRRYFEGGVGVGGRAMIGERIHGPGPHAVRRSRPGRDSRRPEVEAIPTSSRRSSAGRGSRG